MNLKKSKKSKFIAFLSIVLILNICTTFQTNTLFIGTRAIRYKFPKTLEKAQQGDGCSKYLAIICIMKARYKTRFQKSFLLV